MGKVSDLAEKAWAGGVSGTMVHPLAAPVLLEEFAPGLAFVNAFANVLVVDTDEGLVLVDTSSMFHAESVREQVRGWSKKPVHTAVYTHGHVDHVFGILAFDDEARRTGSARPVVIGHESVPARFDRYLLTNGYNGIINQRQFGLPAPMFPTQYRYPDRTFQRELSLSIGGELIELHHDKGETDDHVWAFLPRHRALYTGDLFIWASPNCGNPQKVQRYPREWAAALRAMDKLGAETLFPGHGPPIVGKERVSQALTETAELLETVVEQTLARMNQGARLNDIVHAVKVPARLLERPYLRAVYDDPEFIIHNVYRLYGGWWDGDPASLKPAPDAELARALAELSGGAGALAQRALAEAASGALRLACHLVELAYRAAPEDSAVRAARATIYEQRAEAESSLMAKGIFRYAAQETAGK